MSTPRSLLRQQKSPLCSIFFLPAKRSKDQRSRGTDRRLAEKSIRRHSEDDGMMEAVNCTFTKHETNTSCIHSWRRRHSVIRAQADTQIQMIHTVRIEQPNEVKLRMVKNKAATDSDPHR